MRFAAQEVANRLRPLCTALNGLAMKYTTGENIELGDVVIIPIPTGSSRMKVVMLGASNEHLDIDKSFLRWVSEDRRLSDCEVVLEWIDENIFLHNDPNIAPVGNYMFSGVDEFLEFQTRAIDGE